MKWWPRQKDSESQKEQKQPESPSINTHRSSIKNDVQDGHMQAAIGFGSTLVTHISANAIDSSTQPSELPYVGRNLDALQERVAKIVIGLSIVHHQPTPEWAVDVMTTINRIQAQAKDYGSEVTRLVGKRELMLTAGREPVGPTYPIIAIISDVVLPDVCMLWVPGDESFYRLIAYRGEGFDNNRMFDGSTLVFDEGLFTGSGHYCCKVDPWGRSDKLRAVPRGPDDPLVRSDPLAGWVAELFSCLQTQIPLRCKVPIVAGKPSDRSTWRWCNEARGLHIIVLGNMV